MALLTGDYPELVSRYSQQSGRSEGMRERERETGIERQED